MLNLFSLFTAEWDPGCFTLISCAAGGTFLAEPCKKKKKETRVTEEGVHVTGEGQGQEVSAPEETARQSLCARAQESTWSQRGEARGEDEYGQQRQGGRGEGERRGVEESRGEVRTREDKRGSNSLPNQIGWFSAKQPDHRRRCTVQHPLTEFWDGPRLTE